ncbi:hypothetical protein MNO14_14980 [Luteimonas sp. S4-F44]|uniref:hypothetical protein n=1 Tax=Luteimonas sp. S4-F44 TaxID=2925842 RepID=UPI001F53402E|nr:hypothetical protein [Luteimonas sp. S4-F44]UNK42227.1 hypothetical protein MNO14_14980 [Luteimonas sp. S4-F44]
MFEMLSSNFESRLSLDLRNLETGRIHRRDYAGKRCYGSLAKVGSRWELPAVTDRYEDGSLRELRRQRTLTMLVAPTIKA